MSDIFNTLESYDIAVILLVLIAIILDIFLFKKYLSESTLILKGKEYKSWAGDENLLQNTKLKSDMESDVKKYKKISTDSRNTLIVYVLIGFTIFTLTSNLILIAAALSLMVVGLGKYLFFRQIYKAIYEIYLDVNDMKKF